MKRFVNRWKTIERYKLLFQNKERQHHFIDYYYSTMKYVEEQFKKLLGTSYNQEFNGLYVLDKVVDYVESRLYQLNNQDQKKIKKLFQWLVDQSEKLGESKGKWMTYQFLLALEYLKLKNQSSKKSSMTKKSSKGISTQKSKGIKKSKSVSLVGSKAGSKTGSKTKLVSNK